MFIKRVSKSREFSEIRVIQYRRTDSTFIQYLLKNWLWLLANLWHMFAHTLWSELVAWYPFDPIEMFGDPCKTGWSSLTTATTFLMNKTKQTDKCVCTEFIHDQWSTGIVHASTLTHVDTQWTNHLIWDQFKIVSIISGTSLLWDYHLFSKQ